MAVVGQKISGLAPAISLEESDGILIQRGQANWRLEGRALASSTSVLNLSTDLKQNYIPKPPTPSAGQLLTWNSTTRTWVASGAPVSVPQGNNTGDLLVYSKSTSTWTVQPSSVLIPKTTDSVPIGTIVAYASSAPPAGWLPCDGRLLAKTGIYADLYKAIGDAFTSPVQVNFFKVPDLRGEFVRGWDGTGTGARGVDLNRTFGTNQSESISAHSHSIGEISNTQTGYKDDVGDVLQYPISDVVPSGTSGSIVNQTSTVGSTETRPRNVALLYCIKFATTDSLNTLGLSAQAILDRLPFGYFGQNQTWQDVRIQRQVGVWYTNTTQVPIAVHASHNEFGYGGQAYMEIRPLGSGTTVTIKGTYGDGDSSFAVISVVVPPNYQYKLTVSTGTAGVDNWVELR